MIVFTLSIQHWCRDRAIGSIVITALNLCHCKISQNCAINPMQVYHDDLNVAGLQVDVISSICYIYILVFLIYFFNDR